jgi:trimeric autotransporter adhesin
MEPEDLLRAGENEPKAGANELRAIVARAQRRRWRVGVAGLAAALAIGGGVGYALSNHHSSGQSVATSPESGPKAGSSSPAGQSGPAAGSGRSSSSSSTGPASSAALYPERLQPLFTRTAGSVDVRGFLLSSSIKLPQGYAMPSCAITGPRFEAEVSTTKMVGTVVAGYAAPDPAQTLSGVSASIVGVAEGDPILVVTADAGKGVAQVKVTGFAGGGTDSMAPVGGWVALAGPTTTTSSPSTISPVKVGTISALSGSGQVLASESVTTPTVFGGGPLPLSSAAGARAANGASVVCEGAGTGSGPIAPGQGTGTFHVICPPSSVPGTVLPGASTGTGGGVPSNGGSAGSASASAACSVRVEPANTGSSSSGSSGSGSSSTGSSSAAAG